MRSKNGLNIFHNHDRKPLYIFLSILLVSVLTLTVVYAALSTTLNISGNAEVTAAGWDIHFDNIQVNPASVAATTAPTISGSKTINFGVTLTKPGDFYKFSVDIVNEGTIDAMIDSVVKTPELTTEQAKYIKYEIEYTDGNLISSKQLLPKDETKTISVLVSYRTDLTASSLPTEATTLNLSFSMVYTQADSTGTAVPEGTEVKVVSGDLNTVGSEICIGEECFYLMKNDGRSVTMLAKYNLYVGNECSSSTSCIEYENVTGIQNLSMVGCPSDYSYPRYGTTQFGLSTSYSSSIIVEYINNYKVYLEHMNIQIEEARLITPNELEKLGCVYDYENISGSCLPSSYNWIYSTSYWTSIAYEPSTVWTVRSDGYLDDYFPYINYSFGVRPVIKIPLTEF